MKRDGQFFIIGIVIITGLILGAAALRGGTKLTSTADSGVQNTFDRHLDELPRTAGIALEDKRTSASVERALTSHLEYQQFVEAQRGLESQTYFLVGIPLDDHVNITVGNYWSSDVSNLWITVDGESTNLGSVAEEEIVTERFETDAKSFQVEINFSGQEQSFSASRKAFSLFKYRLEAEGNVWQDVTIN